MKKLRNFFVVAIVLILLGLGFLFNHVKENKDDTDFISIYDYNEHYHKIPDEE